MEYLFSPEKMAELLKQYYNVTHIRIAFLDLKHQDILGYPLERSPICNYIRSNPEADLCCKKCDKESCAISKERGTVYSYQCHAGLYEMIVPLKINHSIVGYLFFSHMLKGNSKEEVLQTIIEKTKGFHLNPEKIREAAKDCPLLNESFISSAVYLLNTIATYLCMDSLGLFRQKDPIAFEMEEYIHQHIHENFQIKDMCKALGIGKTKLCSLAQKYFDESIHQHIQKERISMAKSLLINEEFTISEIAQKCGFNDYNYFIHVFKQNVGISPHQFCKKNKSDRFVGINQKTFKAL